jgi:hypothetical protein
MSIVIREKIHGTEAACHGITERKSPLIETWQVSLSQVKRKFLG